MTTRPILPALPALLALMALLVVALPSPTFADSGKGHTALASKTVRKALAKSGVVSPLVSTKVSKIRTHRQGNNVDIRCQVRITVASKDGRRIGPGHGATMTGNGRVTAFAHSARTVKIAQSSCVVEVASDLAKRKVAPFLAGRVATLLR